MLVGVVVGHVVGFEGLVGALEIPDFPAIPIYRTTSLCVDHVFWLQMAAPVLSAIAGWRLCVRTAFLCMLSGFEKLQSRIRKLMRTILVPELGGTGGHVGFSGTVSDRRAPIMTWGAYKQM